MSEDADSTHPGSRSREAWNIPWRVCGGPKEDTVDGCRVTEGVDKSDGDRTLLGGGAEDIGYPGEDERREGVDTAKCEDDEDVLDHPDGIGDDDDEEDTTETASDRDEERFFLQTVCGEAEEENNLYS